MTSRNTKKQHNTAPRAKAATVNTLVDFVNLIFFEVTWYTISLCSRAHLPPACCAQVRQKLFGKNRAVYLRARLTESRWDLTEPEGQARTRLDISGKRVHLRLGSWGGLQAPPAASPAQSPGSGGSPPKMGRGRELPRARLPFSAPGLCLQPQAGSLPRLRYRASLVCLWLPRFTEPEAYLSRCALQGLAPHARASAGSAQ